MSRLTVISIKRKVTIGSGIAVLLLTAVGCSYLLFNDAHDPEDALNVSIASDRLPINKVAFENSLPKGVTGIILVSQSKNENDGPVITAITPKGDPINLCGSKSKDGCRLTTTASALAYSVSGVATDMGTCDTGTRQCHMEGNYKDKWYWHKTPDGKRHFSCPDSCQ